MARSSIKLITQNSYFIW